MRLIGFGIAIAALVELGGTARASMVFFRSVPAEGGWAEWTIASNITTEGIQPKVKLVAGKQYERDGLRYQIVDLSGTWEDDGKPFPMRARYEVNLDMLQKQGFPRKAVRLITAYEVQGEAVRELGKDSPYIAFYECIVMGLDSAAVAKESVRLDKPSNLRKYELRMLTAKPKTQFGRGSFNAWVGDDVPYGVAKWETTNRVGSGYDETVVTITATLTSSGKEPGKTDASRPSSSGKEDRE